MKADAQKRWLSIGVLSLTIGILDYFTGYEFSFFVFYFLPVSLAAWFIGKSGAVVFAIFCSIVWAGAFIFTGHFVITDFLSIWNAAIRLAAFLAIGLLVSTIKTALRIEKETARKLRESIIEREKTEASYRMLFDTMDEAFAIKEMIEDSDGMVDFLFIEANPAFERQTGLKDVAGRTMRQLMPGIEPRWMERYAKVVKTGERLRFEDYVVDLKRWFSVLCWRIEGTENRRAAILATDITERKKAQEALGIAYSRLQTLFDHRIEGVGIAISNAAGNVIQANDHLLNIFGCTREELISGKVDWRALTPPEWQPADDYALRQLKNGGLYHAVEKEYVRRDGSRVPVLVTGVTMPGDSGEILSFVLDITERKKFEQSLKQLNMTLEQQVTERTKLAGRRAKQLQVLAMELIESEEQERRRIAELLHDDLQQVLAATLMQLDLCGENLNAAAELDFVRRLLKESISKARSLSHELSPTVLYHSGLVAGLRWLANQMNEKLGLNVQLDVHTDEKVDFSLTQVFIYRAVQELLFNVVKHSAAKSARVALTNTEKNIHITVSDEGQGFNTDLLESASTKAGLGLMSVRERANYFGGNLEINSSPGQGSRFTLTLPITLQAGDPSIK
ncbi:MAG: hypothetical protein VR64_04065 [Desulfatitalea sp. BRH_c12]|nr:MAG: hypothetical protein VR64_04065 [Desulfatitalea sp. BRH_c12]